MQAISRDSSPKARRAGSEGLLPRRPDQLLFRFIVPEFVTTLGEHLKVVGSVPELGSWDITCAPGMQWHEGHRWVLETRLPKNTDFEFKVVAVLGHSVRWEQGINRIVQTGDDGLDVAVELVINLTCSFDYTQSTGVELVLDRTSIQESFELASATLELLQKRRSRLVRALQETTEVQGPALAEQQAEAARLDAAVSNQAKSLDELEHLVSNSKLSEDGKALLLSVKGTKIELPRGVGMLSQAHNTISLALGNTMEAAKQIIKAATASPSPPPAARLSPQPPTSANGHSRIAAAELLDSWERERSRSPSPGSDDDWDPDDAAAAMAAAAYASLADTKQRRRRRRSRKMAAAAAAAAATPAASPAAAGPAGSPPAAAPAAAAAAGKGGNGSVPPAAAAAAATQAGTPVREATPPAVKQNGATPPREATPAATQAATPAREPTQATQNGAAVPRKPTPAATPARDVVPAAQNGAAAPRKPTPAATQDSTPPREVTPAAKQASTPAREATPAVAQNGATPPREATPKAKQATTPPRDSTPTHTVVVNMPATVATPPHTEKADSAASPPPRAAPAPTVAHIVIQVDEDGADGGDASAEDAAAARSRTPDARPEASPAPVSARALSLSPLPVDLPKELPLPRRESSGALLFTAEMLSVVSLPPPTSSPPRDMSRARSQSRAKLAIFFSSASASPAPGASTAPAAATPPPAAPPSSGTTQ